MIQFTRGVPPAESFPKEELGFCAKTVIEKYGDLVLQYGGAAGFEPLRDWIAEKYQINTSRVILGQGSLQLLDFLIHSWMKPGDLVFVEQPSYDRSLTLFRRAGLQLKGFDLVEGRMDLDDIEKSLRSGLVPKAFYIIPDFQNPSGALMPDDCRQRLLKLAIHYGFTLIEDGPYRHLRYSGNPVASLIEQNQENVIHMSSFSKMISPGLRVGFMIAPQKIITAIQRYAEDSYINPSYFNQAVVYEFIAGGSFENHIHELLTLYSARLQVMLDSLTENIGSKGAWVNPQGGFFVGLTLNNSLSVPDEKTCISAGIELSKGKNFFLQGGERFVRLPFCALSCQDIQIGIHRLAEII